MGEWGHRVSEKPINFRRPEIQKTRIGNFKRMGRIEAQRERGRYVPNNGSRKWNAHCATMPSVLYGFAWCKYTHSIAGS